MQLSTIYFEDAPYILIGVGAGIVVFGSFGCCCTFKGNSVLLYMVRLNFNRLPNKPWFLHVFSTSFENTVGKGAISPLPTEFSTRLENFLPFSSNLKICGLQIVSVWKSLKLVVWERVKPLALY